jgi:hypothetical protein
MLKKMMTLAIWSGGCLTALGLNCIPNIGGGIVLG